MGRRKAMKKLVGLLLVIPVMTLVFAVPTAATKPIDVSGRWADGAPIIPPAPAYEPRGDNCLVTVSFWHEWGDGNFRGRDETDFRILVHGPCETSVPNLDRAKLKGTGTFEGNLCLGEWENTDCFGEMYSGSFDFEWHLTDPNPDPTVDTFTGKLVVLQGHDGLENLHGVLEMWGRTGPGGVVAYSGQVHIDPQP
jgi:hypothetical protein